MSDINYNDDQLTWTYTGDNVIQIDFDPITHIVRFESPVDEAVEQITFTVTNPDGLTASDISVATAFKDNSITLLNSLVIRAHVVGDDHMEAGDTLQLGVSVENVGSKDIDNVQMTAIVHSLDMRDKVGPFNVDGYELVSKRLYLFVPADAKEGTYDIRLTISNDDVRRVIYRQFDID